MCLARHRHIYSRVLFHTCLHFLRDRKSKTDVKITKRNKTIATVVRILSEMMRI